MAENQNPHGTEKTPEIPGLNCDSNEHEQVEIDPIAESSFEKARKAFFEIGDTISRKDTQ